MIKEALEYLNIKFLDSAAPVIIGNRAYSHTGLTLIKTPEAKPLTLHTLQGLVDYINELPEEAATAFLHVLSPEKVLLVMPLTIDTRQRETLIEADLIQSAFPFGRYVGQEEFIVGIQSQFVETDIRANLLKIAGSITSEAVNISEDDGVTQRATAKVGIARQATIDLPNPIALRPYRTFIEIEQPESLFVLRMRTGAQLALFEADGGAWRNKAIRDIEFWLTDALKGKKISIIA